MGLEPSTFSLGSGLPSTGIGVHKRTIADIRGHGVLGWPDVAGMSGHGGPEFLQQSGGVRQRCLLNRRPLTQSDGVGVTPVEPRLEAAEGD